MSPAGFVLLFCLGIAAAGEQPAQPPPSSPHHHDHRHDVAHVTTVCIQMHGPQSGPLCGPMVPPPDGQPSPAGRSSGGPASSLKAGEPYRFEQPVPMQQQQQQQQRMVPQHAVFQDYYQSVPVYQLSPARASQLNQPHSAASKSAGPSGNQMPGPCPDAAQQNHQFNQQSHPPAVRTFPFAPFGIEDGSSQSRMAQPQPLTSYGMRMAQQQPMPPSEMRMAQQQPMPPSEMRMAQAQLLARQNQQMPPPQSWQQPSQLLARMMPQSQGPFVDGPAPLPPSEIYGSAVHLLRAASDCADGSQNQQPQHQQRAVIKGVPPQVFRTSGQQEPQSTEEWKRQCEEKEKEILKKSEEISELRKQLERMAAIAEKSATTMATTSSSSTRSVSTKDQQFDKDPSDDSKKEEKSQNPGSKKKRSVKA